DYTKGIPERLQAIERLLEKYPDWRERFHFVQLGAPSRTNLPDYRNLNQDVQQLSARINQRFGTSDWQPVVFHNQHVGPEVIVPLFREAAGCVVTSLHDGMNLVAKEFVAARDDQQGVLVLSKFTGSARELHDAVIINPHDIEEVADACHLALT